MKGPRGSKAAGHAELPVATVVIVTRNRQSELTQTLQSIYAQSVKEIEIIVIDDGSDDGTAHYLSSHHPSVRLVRLEEPAGYIRGRNLGLQMASSKFVFSLDDDFEFVREDCVERALEVFERYPNAGALTFGVFDSLEPIVPDEILAAGEANRITLKRSYIGCGHALRKSCFEKTGPYPEWFFFYSEETFLSIRLYQEGYAVLNVPSVYVRHRVLVEPTHAAG